MLHFVTLCYPWLSKPEVVTYQFTCIIINSIMMLLKDLRFLNFLFSKGQKLNYPDLVCLNECEIIIEHFDKIRLPCYQNVTFILRSRFGHVQRFCLPKLLNFKKCLKLERVGNKKYQVRWISEYKLEGLLYRFKVTTCT